MPGARSSALLKLVPIMSLLSDVRRSPRVADGPRMVVIGSSGLSDVVGGEGGGAGFPSEGIGLFAPLGYSPARGWRYLGGLDRLGDVLQTSDIKEAVIRLDVHDWTKLEAVICACADQELPVSISLDIGGEETGAPRSVSWNALVKRVVDVVGAGAGLLIAAPLLAVVALHILVTDGRPVTFRQWRAGRNGRPFCILKFRTMHQDADALRAKLRVRSAVSGAAFKMERDPRVTRLGQWLRRTSIDELPQLWNVLKGEMSLVGPRPHPYDDVARYKPWHLARLAVKPGITGLWQLEMRNEPEFDRWVEKDLEYIRRRSIGLDLSILLRTLPAVLRGSGR